MDIFHTSTFKLKYVIFGLHAYVFYASICTTVDVMTVGWSDRRPTDLKLHFNDILISIAMEEPA